MDSTSPSQMPAAATNDPTRVIAAWMFGPLPRSSTPQPSSEPQLPARCTSCINLRSRASWYYCAGSGRTLPRCAPGTSDVQVMDDCPTYEHVRV